MTINFNTEPYYDDFDENKGFYRILYRPGYAVQARELTQMQTILQNQVSRFGDHVFKEGSMVIPGQISVDTKIGYIKLEASYNNILADGLLPNLLGGEITSASGVVAEVIYYAMSSASDEPTLFVRYKDSGTDRVTKTFADGEVISDMNSLYEVKAIAVNSTGVGSIATIQRGVYYVKGHFVLCPEQTIILDKYSDTPSYRIGLFATEDIITTDQDPSLLDNAQNSFNYAAPGAHRYVIDLTLSKLALDSVLDIDFIELVRVGEGSITRQVNTTAYSVLEQTLARRTYDESGNYTVKPFEIDIREYRNNNRGVWTSSTVYLAGDVVTNTSGVTYVARTSGTSVDIEPSHSSGDAYDGPGATGVVWQYNTQPYYNRGAFEVVDTDTLSVQQANEAKLAIGLEPGKAYVSGYELEKIATEYVAVQKSREYVDVNNANIPATVGNYILVTNVNNIPDIDTYAQIELRDQISSSGYVPQGNIVGYARCRGIEWHNGTIGQRNAIYKLFLFDVKLNPGKSFERNVKGVYAQGATNDGNLNFLADIEYSTAVGSAERLQLIGSVTASASTAVTGAGTSFQTDLVVGDYVLLGTTLRRVTAVNSQTSITVDSAITVTGETISRIQTTIKEPESVSLLFPFDNYAVKSVRGSAGNDTVYSVMEMLTGTAGSTDSGGTGYCNLTVGTSSGTMASEAETDNYIVVWNDTTSGGAIIAPVTTTRSGSSVTFKLLNTYAGDSFKVIATVNKSGDVLTERQKSLQSAVTATFTTQATATKTEVLLSKADGYRLISVKMDSGSFAAPSGNYTVDITDRYDFDDGQRDTHYDLARIILKNSYAPPTAPIQVTFDYFTHTAGDYFTVNSYSSAVQYKQIPYYKGVSLRDSIDFRPRINDNGTTYSSDSSLTPKRGIDITTDYSYYLARKTKIALDFAGNFFAIDGVSSLNPGEPLDPALGMVLYTLSLEPYTFGTGPSSINVTRLDNKRYTMRDIGKLEKRIDNLEYYTSLSLLEQQTEGLDIIDGNGNTRFKNGFVVDNFSGHKTGELNSPDYLCSIDMEQGELRPFYSMQNINLLEKQSDQSTRINTYNYQLYGDVITLPVIEHTPLITQAYASRLENINPFAVFTFLGDVKINPSSDEWFEVDRRPDVVIDVEGNFNTLKNLAEQAGVLGTVWNAWQNQWAGAPVTKMETYHGQHGAAWVPGKDRAGVIQLSPGEMNARFGFKQGAGWAFRALTVESTAQEIGQSRTGIKTTLVTKIDRQVVADRVLSTAAIPYIRSRNVLIQVKKLKPHTKFYPFFDNIDILEYCTPASKLIYVPTGSTTALQLATHDAFDVDTNVGGLASAVERRIDGDTQSCLNRGDVIEGVTSGATAVVVGKEYDIESGYYALWIVNIKGTFQANETIGGSVSGKTGIVSSVTVATKGGDIVTDYQGNVQLLFNIPNTEATRFRCGSREFKLVDVPEAQGVFTSRGRASYYAAGVLETKQQTVHAVRNAELVEEQVADNRVIIQTSERVVADTGWYDPLAQTFLIDSDGGAFLTKVDIFFATKDPSVPVTLEIREVVNGYPGKRVLPFSRVTLDSSKVNISNNTVLLNDVNVPSYDTATTFNFPSPVYVENNTEYCFVLSSDSNNYKVWISQIGDTIPGSSRTISEQPYLGSLFKSQNASTWTPDQTQDIKFVIYRAKFDTSVVADVEFVNDVLPYRTIEVDPFETKTGSTTVRVWHRDHGMPAGSRVTIEGVASSVNGIPAASFNTTHTISNVDLDCYTITVGTAATASGYAGGSSVRATRNIQFDAVQPIVAVQSFSETPVSFGLKSASGKSVDSTAQVPYVMDGDFSSILANENNYFNSPRMVASEVNESNSILSGAKSLTMNISMSSSNDRLSPIIDTHRLSLIAIGNKVNSSSETNTNVPVLDETVIVSNVSSGITISGNSITTSTYNAEFSTATVGKYMTLTGSTSGSSTRLITAIADDGSSITFDTEPSAYSGNLTLTQRELFVDEIAPESGSTYSKYVTKKVNLANSSDYIRVKFDANIPADAEVQVWYRTSSGGASLDSVTYTRMVSDTTIIKSENYTEKFYEMSYSANDIPFFDSMQVKLVLKSINSSAVPRVRDLRIIACV